MIRIFLADDHVLVRQALRDFLNKDENVTVVGEASTGPETLAAVGRLRVDIVLLDANMPGRGGLETLEELKALSSSPAVLMLTGLPEEDFAVRCIKSGADGYLMKSQAVAELGQALVKISEGGKYLSSGLAERIVESFDPVREELPHERLTNREFEVMCRLAGGESLAEIAEGLMLSPKTISSYRSKIGKKTGLKSTAEIIRYAFLQGLVK
ncbi:MAG: response regulator transcription factor [Acidobacteriota bacterium]